MIKVEHIHKTYGIIDILNDISFSLERGQKVGLVGYNGTGKSTLLKILAGLVSPDSGKILSDHGLVIGYMPQDTSLAGTELVGDYIRRVSGIADLEKRMESSQEAMDQYTARKGYTFDHRMEMILAGFGLEPQCKDRRIDSLSSGQKSKVFMAGVLLSDPDVLLLDEPTNNLDIPALVWLEDFLIRSSCACIIVSHDRRFLDRVARKIFEIAWDTRTLSITNGKYSDYLARLEKDKERQRAQYREQEAEIERLTKAAQAKKADAARGAKFQGTDNDKFVRGFKRDKSGKSGKVAKAIEKRIEQMDSIDKPVERAAFRIQINPTNSGGSRDIIAREVITGYADSTFRSGPVSCRISYGNRVVILGLNGSGKSTLLRTFSGEMQPLSGEVSIGSAVVIGNFMQEHDNLPRTESIKNFLVRRAGLSVQDAYVLAAKFGFKAAEIDKEIGALSPGGRARLLFALFSALSANTLLLDEPTNHLDLEALAALEEAVANYEGTIVLISHDRCFLEKFPSADVYTLSEGKLARQESVAKYLATAAHDAERLIKAL